MRRRGYCNDFVARARRLVTPREQACQPTRHHGGFLFGVEKPRDHRQSDGESLACESKLFDGANGGGAECRCLPIGRRPPAGAVNTDRRPNPHARVTARMGLLHDGLYHVRGRLHVQRREDRKCQIRMTLAAA